MMYLLGVMNDRESRLAAMSYAMIIAGLFTVALLHLTNLNAAYGRYSSAAWGFMIPGRLAWFVQELPSFTWMVYYLLWSDLKFAEQPVNCIIMLLFSIHYFQR